MKRPLTDAEAEGHAEAIMIKAIDLMEHGGYSPWSPDNFAEALGEMDTERVRMAMIQTRANNHYDAFFNTLCDTIDKYWTQRAMARALRDFYNPDGE